MAATVLRMADHRTVFLISEPVGTVVFLASRGTRRCIAHELDFIDREDAEHYARQLASRFHCRIIGMLEQPESGIA